MNTLMALMLTCALADGVGRSPTGNVQVDLKNKTLHATLKCYDTGDVWWDCDEIHDKITITEMAYDIAFESERAELIYTKASNKASLYVGGDFFFDLTCELNKGELQ